MFCALFEKHFQYNSTVVGNEVRDSLKPRLFFFFLFGPAAVRSRKTGWDDGKMETQKKGTAADGMVIKISFFG